MFPATRNLLNPTLGPEQTARETARFRMTRGVFAGHTAHSVSGVQFFQGTYCIVGRRTSTCARFDSSDFEFTEVLHSQ